MDARKTMDPDAMRVNTERVEDLWTGIDPAVRTSLMTIQLAEQDAYPATLRKEIVAARDELRSAVERGDQAAQDAQLVRLVGLAKAGRGRFADGSSPQSVGSVLPTER